MRIGLYTLFLTPGRIGGIETYVGQLLRSLGQVDQLNQYTIFVTEQNRLLFTDIAYPNFNFVPISLLPVINPFYMRILRRLKIIPSYVAYQIQRYPIDILHYPGTTIDQIEIKFPCILTMHDIQQEYYPDFFSPEVLAWRRATFKLSARKAQQIITDSEFTRQSIIERYKIPSHKITAIPFGVSEAFSVAQAQTLAARVRSDYNLPPEFIFYPANPWPHKNHSRLLEALKLLVERYQQPCHLVLSGIFGPEEANLRQWVAEFGLTGRVHILGYLPPEALPGLYGAAKALIFPSLFEGFGIPVLEAMACGCPVICSNVTSLPELVGDAAVLIDPFDVAQMAEAIYNLLSSTVQQQSLQQKGLSQVRCFSWTRAAQQTLEVYQRTL